MATEPETIISETSKSAALTSSAIDPTAAALLKSISAAAIADVGLTAGPDGQPAVTFRASALKGQLLTMATGAVRLIGTALVTHGALTQVQESTVEPMVIQLVVGTAMVVGGQLWAQAREWLSHHKKAQLALSDPKNIVIQ